MSEESNQTGAGCGLAAYALVLLGVCLAGVLGIVFSTLNLLSQEPEEISQLVHGSEVQVWRLQPMRDAGVLDLTEVPLAWHDESPMRDGTTVCALRPGEVVRVAEGTATRMGFGQISSVNITPGEPGRFQVIISGSPQEITCHFGATEGGDRFAQQLLQEHDRATQSD